MAVNVLSTKLNLFNMRTRMPFKFGIATLTALPHLFLQVECEVDGVHAHGIAADGLVPKWFTKNPESSYTDDLREMFDVIRSACDLARTAGGMPSVFELWHQVYKAQMRWAASKKYPPLLANFGVSLIERAIIDAFCRATQATVSRAVRENLLGIELGRTRASLAGFAPGDLLPVAPVRKIHLRHTIGMADPLTEEEIPPGELTNDGLPQWLGQNIDFYGLRFFKIKICGDAQKDFPRLEKIAEVIGKRTTDYAFTLDGNEQYHDVDAFRTFWEALKKKPSLSAFMSKLLFVEQPLHRSTALEEKTAKDMLAWHDRPATIIDESDSDMQSLPDALAMGYSGTSHKNCKGIIKGLANACEIAMRRKARPDRIYLLSAEDLCNIGPVALLQDLAVVSTLGLDHVERNGHHYFTGLSMFPGGMQNDVLAHHGDLYRRHPRGFATLNVENGAIKTGSVVDAPFGVGMKVDASEFIPLENYDVNSLTDLAAS